ncbi:MAG: CDP-alcohol phosphatidyltransferase family protein [Ruminococcaceae bacterium]|nr:CDP-alcohol phosphatidyltransferase family protein [Oscillospiraceae bacterium]
MTEKPTTTLKNELFTAPNILVYIRILLIPVFVILYLNANRLAEYVWAFSVMAIAFLTDFFDGKIARKFNCVTDLGKTIDPIADKLYQFAVALCLMIEYPLMRSVAIILFIKEISMGIMGLVLIGKGGKIFGAKWYGKICTAFVDLTMVFLLIAPLFGKEISPAFISTLIYCCDAILIIVSVMYTRLFTSKIKEIDQNL